MVVDFDVVVVVAVVVVVVVVPIRRRWGMTKKGYSRVRREWRAPSVPRRALLHERRRVYCVQSLR